MFVSFLFYLSSALTLAGALGVLFTRNIMYACISLLCSLIGVAGLYVTLGADLVAVTQTMVYVGGVVILMLFAVMLTGGKDFKSRMQVMFNYPDAMGNKWTYGVGIAAALVFLAYSAQLIWKIIQSA
ncbi:MAG: NADH-quinone oxidoreductase subunit J, partial [Halobacteriovoraceae bacterium]|nr:NADH-quinone oxidoreductase subunit J [Halobacteriovoraceae bacterium]